MLYCYVFRLLRHSTIACVCVFYADMRNKKIFWSQLLGGNWASHGHLTLEVAKFEANQHTHTHTRAHACAHTQTTGCVLQPAVISQLWQPAMVNWLSLFPSFPPLSLPFFISPLTGGLARFRCLFFCLSWPRLYFGSPVCAVAHTCSWLFF